MTENSLREYEGLFIFPSRLEDEDIDKAVERIKGEITGHGGTAHDVVSLGKKRFARPLSKHGSGHYRRIYFDLPPDQVAALRDRFKFIDGLLRAQVVHRHKVQEQNESEGEGAEEQVQGE